jgi:Short C-terminal domain
MRRAHRPLLRGAMIGGAGYRAGRRAVPPASGGRVDLVSKLQDLKTLMDKGVLTADEFQAAKRKLLAG